MMSLEHGEYFGLQGVGGRLWELLEHPRTLQELCQAIGEEYDVGELECRIDVERFVLELRDKKLVTAC